MTTVMEEKNVELDNPGNIKSCYLAGPMRGVEDYNFPAFHEAARVLRGIDIEVWSPAERDEHDSTIPPNDVLREQGHDWQGTPNHDLAYFMYYDLPAVCEADAVVVMEGWEKSKGARLEVYVCLAIDHKIYYYGSRGAAPILTDITFEAAEEVGFEL